MKKIAEVINFDLKVREQQEPQKFLDAECVKLVDQIFAKIALICRGFDTFYSDRKRLNAEKNQWVAAFTKLNIKKQSDVQRGLDKLELHEFPNPPQLGEFIKWVKSNPQDYGLPLAYDAFNIACKINVLYSDYVHSHAPTFTVIKHVLSQIGSTKFRSMDEKIAQKLFYHYYTVACRQYIDGNIQQINQALPEPNEKPVDRQKSNEARMKAMAAIRGMGIMIPVRL